MNINNLKAILEYSYDEEIKHLEESLSDQYEDFEKLPEDLQEAIVLIETTYPEFTTHIGYNLMILKEDLQKEKKIGDDISMIINQSGEESTDGEILDQITEYLKNKNLYTK